MIGFAQFVAEQMQDAPIGILHKNPVIAKKHRGQLRNLLKEPIKAGEAREVLGKLTNHGPLLKDIDHAAKNYPESDVRPLIKTHIRRLKIPHMGV